MWWKIRHTHMMTYPRGEFLSQKEICFKENGTLWPCKLQSKAKLRHKWLSHKPKGSCWFWGHWVRGGCCTWNWPCLFVGWLYRWHWTLATSGSSPQGLLIQFPWGKRWTGVQVFCSLFLFWLLPWIRLPDKADALLARLLWLLRRLKGATEKNQ